MELVHVSPFSCKNGEKMIRGYEYRPLKKKCPAVIIAHGFMSNQYENRYYAKILSDLGYAVYNFDFCGGAKFGRSDGAHTEMSVLTEQRDLECVYGYVSSLEYIDSEDIILLGRSMGGLVASMFTADHPGCVSSLILFYPAFNMPTGMQTGDLFGYTFDPYEFPDEYKVFGPIKVGRLFFDDCRNIDCDELMDRIDCPVLILHGDRDDIVPLQFSVAANGRLNRLITRSELVIIDNGRHGFKNRRVEKRAGEEMVAYLRNTDLLSGGL